MCTPDSGQVPETIQKTILEESDVVTPG
jgi:hypothetical protein